MTYWASFVCRCVRGRLIQGPMWPAYTFIYVLHSPSLSLSISLLLFSYRDRDERNVHVSSRPFSFPRDPLLSWFIVFWQLGTFTAEKSLSLSIFKFSKNYFFFILTSEDLGETVSRKWDYLFTEERVTHWIFLLFVSHLSPLFSFLEIHLFSFIFFPATGHLYGRERAISFSFEIL